MFKLFNLVKARL